MQDFQREARTPAKETVAVQWSARVPMAGIVYMALPAGALAAHSRESLVFMLGFRSSSNGLRTILIITEDRKGK